MSVGCSECGVVSEYGVVSECSVVSERVRSVSVG